VKDTKWSSKSTVPLAFVRYRCTLAKKKLKKNNVTEVPRGNKLKLKTRQVAYKALVSKCSVSYK